MRLMDKEKQVFCCLSWGDMTRCKSRPPACLKVTFTRLMLALNPKHVPLHIHRSHTHGSHQLRIKNGLKKKIASILNIFSALPPEYHMITFPQHLHGVKCSNSFLGGLKSAGATYRISTDIMSFYVRDLDGHLQIFIPTGALELVSHGVMTV